MNFEVLRSSEDTPDSPKEATTHLPSFASNVTRDDFLGLHLNLVRLKFSAVAGDVRAITSMTQRHFKCSVEVKEQALWTKSWRKKARSTRRSMGDAVTARRVASHFSM